MQDKPIPTSGLVDPIVGGGGGGGGNPWGPKGKPASLVNAPAAVIPP